MSDVPEGSGSIPRRARAGDGGAPISGALAIVLAVVAVVAGFLILRSISDGGENGLGVQPPVGDVADGGDSDATSDATTDDSGAPTLPPTTTQPQLVTTGASVMVANANSTGGSAGEMTRALQAGPGFELVDPTNASAAVGVIDESVIYYDTSNPAAQQVAESLARELGGVETVAPMPETPPTDDGELGGAGVLLMLGTDKAGRTLVELNPGSGATTGSTTTTSTSG